MSAEWIWLVCRNCSMSPETATSIVRERKVLMRAYVAVLKDSFREAFASKLLFVVLGLITLALLFLAPVWVQESRPSEFRLRDFRDQLGVLKKLTDEDTPAAVKQIWQSIPPTQQTQLKELQAKVEMTPRYVNRLNTVMAASLNATLTRRDLYQSTAWKDVTLDEESQAFLKRGLDKLPEADLKRFNRLAIDSAFPFEIQPAEDKGMEYGYLYTSWGTMPAGMPYREFVASLVSASARLIVGMFGILTALLITANVIPQMFEPGAIDLLLSKPVSRIPLFLTKFLGGCAFVFVMTVYLVAGFWLLCGLRTGLWFPRLWLTIPAFVFMFMIYYTASALSGLLWRNAIISAILSLVFFGFLFALENTKSIVDLFAMDPMRIVEITPAGDSMLASSRSGQVLLWKPEGAWGHVFREAEGGPEQLLIYPYLGPVYDQKNDRLAAFYDRRGFNTYDSSGQLMLGPRDGNWQALTTVSSPSGTTAIFANANGEILSAGSAGIHRFQGNPVTKAAPPPLKLFGLDQFDLSKLKRNEETDPPRFEPLTEGLQWNQPRFALHTDGRMVVLEGQELHLLKAGADGKYARQVSHKFEKSQPGLVTCADKTVAVVFKSGEVQTFQMDTLQPTKTLAALNDDLPRQIVISPDGRWLAVSTHKRNLWLYDQKNSQSLGSRFWSQGDISAAAFSPKGTLLLADHGQRITEYNPETLAVEKSFSPTLNIAQRVYYWGLAPLHMVMPKPAQIGELIDFLLTEKSVQALNGKNDDLTATRVTFDLWHAVWSNSIFVAVMLGIGSVYVWSRDL